MKKSEIYRICQLNVVRDPDLDAERTLEILRELFIQEDLAKFAEEQETEVNGE